MSLFAPATQAKLRCHFPEYSMKFLNSVDSTNLECLRCWQKSPGKWFILAATQSQGRGRYGRSWQSAPGNIYVSFTLDNPFAHIGHLNLAVGVLLYEVLIAFSPKLSQILTLKWPNDLYAADKKLAGILLQNLDAHMKKVVVGIGLNVHDAELPPTATSLKTCIPCDRGARTTIVEQLLFRLQASALAKYGQDPRQLLGKFWQYAARTRVGFYNYRAQQRNINATLNRLHQDGTIDVITDAGINMHLFT